MRSVIGKGGGSAGLRTSTSQSPISTWPVGSSGLSVPSGRRRHRARHPHDELAAEIVGAVDDALDETGVVADVDERQVLAMFAASSNPATDADGPSGVLGPQRAAVVGPHGHVASIFLR